jgi:hypothetical protein
MLTGIFYAVTVKKSTECEFLITFVTVVTPLTADSLFVLAIQKRTLHLTVSNVTVNHSRDQVRTFADR